MTPIILVGVGVLALILGVIIGVNTQRMSSELTYLRDRVNKLEDAQSQNAKRRNPYRTDDGIEDAMAIVHDVVWQSAATLNYVKDRSERIDSILKTVRVDPDSYDPDQPNGKVKIVNKKPSAATDGLGEPGATRSSTQS
jgi:hypothetical protein